MSNVDAKIFGIFLPHPAEIELRNERASVRRSLANYRRMRFTIDESAS